MNERNLDPIDLEAAQWVVRLEDREQPTTAREQSEFFAWLMRSPQQVKAFLGVADLSRILDGIDPQRRFDVEKLFAGQRPVPLRARSAVPLVHAAGRRWIGWAAAACVIAAIGGASWFVLNAGTDFQTAAGEQRIVRLPDGSIVSLNTRSHVTISYSKAMREVRLRGGEALFTIERDAARPFLVHTDTAAIRVLGTEFNVYERGGETRVAVVEGAVQVASAATPASTGILEAGEGARVGRTVVKEDQVNLRNTLAWRERRLVFENTPLKEVIAQFNRYNTLQMQAAEPLASDKQLTAVFSADQPQSLIHYLQQDPQLTVEVDGKTVRVRRR